MHSRHTDVPCEFWLPLNKDNPTATWTATWEADMHDITSTESWGKLEKLHAEKSRTTLRDLFRVDD